NVAGQVRTTVGADIGAVVVLVLVKHGSNLRFAPVLGPARRGVITATSDDQARSRCSATLAQAARSASSRPRGTRGSGRSTQGVNAPAPPPVSRREGGPARRAASNARATSPAPPRQSGCALNRNTRSLIIARKCSTAQLLADTPSRSATSL